MTASLDRFGIKNILIMTLFFIKGSRLVDHLKNGPDISASLDRFVMTKIFFMTLLIIKRSRLATIQKLDLFVRFSNGPIFDIRDWHKIESDTTEQASFRILTVVP